MPEQASSGADASGPDGLQRVPKVPKGGLGSEIAALVAGEGALVFPPPRPWTEYKSLLTGGLLVLRSEGHLIGLVAWSQAGARSARLVGLALEAEVANVETLFALLSQTCAHIQRRELTNCLLAPEFAAVSSCAEEALARAGFEARDGELCAIQVEPSLRGPATRVALRTCLWVAAIVLLALPTPFSFPEGLIVALGLAPAVCAAAFVEEWARREALNFRAQLALGCLLALPLAVAGIAQIVWSWSALTSGSPLAGWAALSDALKVRGEVWPLGYLWGGAFVLGGLGPWTRDSGREVRVAAVWLVLSVLGALVAARLGSTEELLLLATGIAVAQGLIASLDRCAVILSAAIWSDYLRRGLSVRYLRSSPASPTSLTSPT